MQNSELPICVRCNGTGKSAELGMILRKCGRCEGLGKLSKSVEKKLEIMHADDTSESITVKVPNCLTDLEKMAELQEQTVEATKKKRGRPPKPKYFDEKRVEVKSIQESISEMKKAALKAYSDEQPERLEKFKKENKHLFPTVVKRPYDNTKNGEIIVERPKRGRPPSAAVINKAIREIVSERKRRAPKSK